MKRLEALDAFVLVIIVAFALVGSKCTYDYRNEIDRLERNNKELMEGFKSDTLKHTAKAIDIVVDGKKELVSNIGKQGNDALERLNVRPSKVEYVNNTIVETRFDTIVKLDTIYKHDTVVQCFSYYDDYISFGGEVNNGKVSFDLQMIDSLTIVCHKMKKKFLFIPYYSRKELETELTNTNPYTRIKFAKSVRVE